MAEIGRAPDQPPARRTALLALLALLAGAVGFWLWRIEGPAFGPLHEASDLFAYFLPSQVYEARRLRALELPLWNPHQGGGLPVLATLQPGALYPARVLLLAFDVPTAMRLSALLHVLIAVGGTYALALALGAPIAGAALAGTVFGGAFALPYLYWPSSLESGVWLPVATLALLRLADTGRWRWALALGLSAGMPILAGGYQTSVYTVYGLALFFLALLADRRRRAALLSASSLLSLTCAAGLALATAAPQLLPTLAWSGEAVRQTTALRPEMIDAVADPLHKLGAFFWNRSILGQTTPLSLPIALLAALGFASAGAFGALSGAATLLLLVLALGRGTPGFALYEAVPGFAMFRMPQRLGFLIAFFAALGAALGVRALARSKRLGAGSRPLAALVAAGAALALLWPLSNLGLLPWNVPQSVVERFATSDEMLRSVAGGSRALAINGYGRGFLPRQGMTAGVRLLHDYEPMSSRRLARLLEAVAPEVADRRVTGGWFYGFVPAQARLARPDLLDLVAVDTLFLSPPAEPPARIPPLERLDEFRGGLVAYRNPGALPRAYLTGAARFAPDEDAARDLLLADSGATRRSPIVAGMPRDEAERALADASAARTVDEPRPVALAVDRPEQLVAQVAVTRPSLLVVSDAWAPGWTASVDGDERRLWLVDAFVRGVVVRPGDRRVELRYRPPGFAAGLAIALAAWTMALLAVLVRALRHRWGRASGSQE